MDLLDLMASRDDLREKALDRLAGIVALYDSDDRDVQDEALARAISLCGNEWGGYRAGLEELACRTEAEASQECVSTEMQALRLREEGADPGAMIRAARARRVHVRQQDDERAAVIARYGSLEAAVAPSPIEIMFISATASLANSEPPGLPVEEGGIPPDPVWGPLAGWSVPWHDIPAELVAAVISACALPTTIGDARDEALTWEQRKRERALLGEGPGAAILPTACTARHRLVEDLWKRGLVCHSPADFEIRLEYWVKRGGDDGAGYAILQRDLAGLGSWGASSAGIISTKDKARRLRSENPEWSLARIGKELGISRQAVHKHLKK